jgi:tetratricopeptide (TPR) repeat protein
MEEADVARIRFARAWLEGEIEAGREHAPRLLAMRVGEWRQAMEEEEDLRRYGTLRRILEVIREDLFTNPERARERASIVIAFAPRAYVPNPQYGIGIVGLAWKEYANALRYAGENKDAIEAARKAYAMFDRHGSFACEAAKARLIEALVLRETGERDKVLTIARACARVFRDYADAGALVQARMTEALVLADAKQYRAARAILAETAADAEGRGDHHTLAICLHNSAEYARALGDRAAAADLDARALKHFEELGTTVEKPRVRWTHALSLADEGRISEAILELYKTTAEFIALGMNGDAACCGLDVVRLRFERGQDVSTMCVDLVDQFTKGGMTQNAIEALAYLREEAHRHTISIPKIRHVRDYVLEASRGPARAFLPPPDDLEEREGDGA